MARPKKTVTPRDATIGAVRTLGKNLLGERREDAGDGRQGRFEPREMRISQAKTDRSRRLPVRTVTTQLPSPVCLTFGTIGRLQSHVFAFFGALVRRTTSRGGMVPGQKPIRHFGVQIYLAAAAATQGPRAARSPHGICVGVGRELKRRTCGSCHAPGAVVKTSERVVANVLSPEALV